MGKPAHNSRPGKSKGKDKKPMKAGTRAFKEKKQEYLKKQLKKEVKKNELKKKQEEQTDPNKIRIAWKGREKEVDKKTLQGDKKGRELLKKLQQKRVLSADEKHRLKMLGEAGDLMKLWEILREKNRAKDEKEKAIKQILEFTQETFSEDVRKPDMSRIFQSVLKWGDDKARTEVFNRVKGQISDLCQCSHSNQFAKSLLDHSTSETREEFFREITKAGGKLLSQKNALLVLEHLYNKSNAEKQNILLTSFFDGIEIKTMEGYPRLFDILSNLSPTSLDYKMIIERLHKVISPSITKGAFDNVVIHRLLELLLKFGTDFEVNDVIEEVTKGVVNIARTKPGAAAAGYIVSYASKNARKSILKSFQHSVVDMCCAKSTAFFMARLFDIIDDTEFVSKTLCKEMIPGMLDLLQDPMGSIVLLHLLTPDPERKKKYITFSHFDALWNSSREDPTHMDTLNSKYMSQKRKLCDVHPEKKHTAILTNLLPVIIDVIMQNFDSMIQNVISRRVITEIVHLTSTKKGLKVNPSALATMKKALEQRTEAKGKRKADDMEAEDSPATKPVAKRAKKAAKPAAKAAPPKEDKEEVEAVKKPAKKAKKVVKKVRK